MQGYFFSRPLPAAAARNFLLKEATEISVRRLTKPLAAIEEELGREIPLFAMPLASPGVGFAPAISGAEG